MAFIKGQRVRVILALDESGKIVHWLDGVIESAKETKLFTIYGVKYSSSWGTVHGYHFEDQLSEPGW